ncbi:COA8 family protein CG14806, mitochondrial isoform X2 [Chrysoperla carnea]|uniref:COA8 family protein CG14806, mitochondrial isoform X2 n=1 Tax=Chrysoperla carnea TaxID=189513 RepID=UPI001D08AF59|nr:COA8 family protein CG14806, mitochondrial isoform X2 [Chrysoperla carnea]
MLTRLFKRTFSSKLQSEFINKDSIELKIKTLEKSGKDIIGPPDPVSNLRPIIRHETPNETLLEARLRQKQNETQEWNHQFWTKHNNKFFKERKEYISLYTNGDDKSKLTADEMSLFYKSFLDKNWRTHFDYNLQWSIHIK